MDNQDTLDRLIEEAPKMRVLDSGECRLVFVADYGGYPKLDGTVNAEDFSLALSIAREGIEKLPYESAWRIYSSNGLKLAESKNLALMLNRLTIGRKDAK